MCQETVLREGNLYLLWIRNIVDNVYIIITLPLNIRYESYLIQQLFLPLKLHRIINLSFKRIHLKRIENFHVVGFRTRLFTAM